MTTHIGITVKDASKAQTIRKLKEEVNYQIKLKESQITAEKIYEVCPLGEYIIFDCSDGIRRVLNAWTPENHHSNVNLKHETLNTVYPNLNTTGISDYNECVNCLCEGDFLQYLNKFEIKKRWEIE